MKRILHLRSSGDMLGAESVIIELCKYAEHKKLIICFVMLFIVVSLIFNNDASVNKFLNILSYLSQKELYSVF